MIDYASGWLREWRPDGETRFRFQSVPMGQRFHREGKRWVPCEPGTLWIKEVKRFRNRQLRQKRRFKQQMTLPGMEVQETPSTPLQADPGVAAERLWRDLPQGWMNLLEPVKVRPWPSLEFLHGLGSVAEDLYVSRPGLAWLLACTCLKGVGEERDHRFFRLERELMRRQKELLPLLHLSPTPWMVKMTDKLMMDQDPAIALRRLRWLETCESARRIFQHADPMPGHVWRLVQPEIAPMLTRELVLEVAGMDVQDNRFAELQRNLHDCGILAKRGENVPRFRSCLELEHWQWERYAELGLDKGTRKRGPNDFPSAPYPGTPTIRPILTKTLLEEEGLRMRHCIKTYLQNIQRGTVAVYAVFEPERATLGLTRTSDGGWRVLDFRCRCNRKPTLTSRRRVGAWLAKHGVEFS